MLAASCEEPLQEDGHFMAAAQELVEDGQQVGEVGHHGNGQPGLPGDAGDGLDGQGRVALVDAGQASLRLTGVPAAMLAARRRTRRSPLLQGSSLASSAAIAASQSMLASMVPWSLPSTAVMNRLVKSSRRSQQPHPAGQG
jgi:hypothetical protein